MTTEEALADLWRYIGAGQGRENGSSLVQSWIETRIEHNEQVTPDLLYAIAEKRLDWPSGEHYTPQSLTSFIGRLASRHPAQSVLDPTCGLGLLLHQVAFAAKTQVIHGIDINAECRNVAQAILGNKATILQGDALASTGNLQPTYDLIVANPPFGMRIRGAPILPHLGNHFGGELGHALAVWACARLGESGTAFIAVTPAFLWSQHGLEAQEAIRKSGYRIRALIHLPGGTFPHTGISSYLAAFERGEQREVFVGEFADSSEQQNALIENYIRHKPGDQPALGRLCALSAFRGFDAFVAQERLKRLVGAAGWSEHSANSVILKAERLSSTVASAEPDVNGLYLRLVGQPTALLDPAGLPRSAVRDSVRLSINPKIADARYLIHWLNESQVGQVTLASLRQGGATARLDLTALLTAKLHLPPLAEQRQFLDGVAHLNRVRAEAMELQSALWSGKENVDAVVDRIVNINREDRYEDWIETLPFPLASILWRHRAGGGSTRERYEVLLHFFEATAAFVATIHLSAFMADDVLWSEASQGLLGSLEKQHLSLERATFGAWKLTTEYLSGRCRRLLGGKDGWETCTRVYGTPNHNRIDMICHADLLTVLQRANSIRNSSSGHSGAVGQDEANSIHDELVALVHKIRGIFGRSWLDYELIQPSEGRYRGGLHHYKARRLMGTRSTPFEMVERESTHLLVDDRLYLFDAISQKGLLLRPFIRVMPSPKKKANACFIFSRLDKAGMRFVSYHFEEESSLTDSFSDVDEAFRRLHMFDNRAKL